MYFDIGANIGKWSEENMHLCNRIIAVEASPTTYDKLVNNIGNNPRFSKPLR
jgi:FkbM family methyltransferase